MREPASCSSVPSNTTISTSDLDTTAVPDLSTPLLSAVQQESSSISGNFFCPGHKRGAAASASLKEFIGDLSLQHDLPELPALDNLFAPEGVILEAQTLATEAFIGAGASRVGWSTFFLVNGSTCGIEAAILACVRPGRSVLLPRNVHQSAVHALVLSGAVPVWIDPVYDSSHDILHGVTPQAVEDAITANSDTLDAVFVVSPTYHGVCSDLRSIAEVAHARNLPLIVDEAHGAHFTFHHSLPASAASCGADVVIQSTHKTLGALTQAAMMHVRDSSMVRASRVALALQLVQSTSPSYLLLSSLDAARSQMVSSGERDLLRAIDLASDAAHRISELSGFSILRPSTSAECELFDIDATRVTVLLPPSVSGFDLDDFLIAQFGVYAELPTFRHVTFIFTPGNSEADVDILVKAISFFNVAKEITGPPPKLTAAPLSFYKVRAARAMTPRDAFFSLAERVSCEQAVGRVSAVSLCPYPPGIPVVCPGEIISQECVDFLLAVIESGGSVTGAGSGNLTNIQVVAQ